MAKSGPKERTGYQDRATVGLLPPVRVILPTSAEAAQPPQPLQEVATVTPTGPVKEVELKKHVEKVDTKKAEAEVRERRGRYAERKIKREAARARRPLEARVQDNAPVMAFSGDDTSRLGRFGN